MAKNKGNQQQGPKPDNPEKEPQDKDPEDEMLEKDVATMDATIEPFEIEADHPRNMDLLIQCIPGLKLRSTLDGKKHVVDAKSGEKMISEDQIRALGGIELPGMRLYVNPARLSYRVKDPLRGDEELCSRIEKHMRKQGFPTVKKVDGVETVKGTLDEHRMKSLVREMKHLVANGHAKVVQGQAPSTSQIENLPGEFLLNPGARTHWNQPTFEKDWDDWYSNLMKSGG